MTILCSAAQRTDTSCMQRTQTAGARTLNFTSFNYGFLLNSPTVKLTDYEIYRFTLCAYQIAGCFVSCVDHFGAYSSSFYEWRIAGIWSGDNFDVFRVFLTKQHNI